MRVPRHATQCLFVVRPLQSGVAQGSLCEEHQSPFSALQSQSSIKQTERVPRQFWHRRPFASVRPMQSALWHATLCRLHQSPAIGLDKQSCTPQMLLLMQHAHRRESLAARPVQSTVVHWYLCELHQSPSRALVLQPTAWQAVEGRRRCNNSSTSL